MFRIALAAAAALVSTATVAAPATPASAVAIDTLWVDEDTFTVRPVGGGSEYARFVASSYLRDSNLQGLVKVHLYRPAALVGCRAARVQFTYADGKTTTTAASARVCKEHSLTDRDVELRSSTSKDLVSFRVELLTATDDAAPMTVMGGRSEIVGDAPDSYGNAGRLDHDTHAAKIGTRTLFTGSSNWFLQKHTIDSVSFSWWTSRARVIGTLTWDDGLAGSSAYLYTRWTYADGSHSASTSASIYRDRTETASVSLVSDSTKEVVAVRLEIRSSGATTVLGGSTKLGDWAGIA
jgi:hypothetical protein